MPGIRPRLAALVGAATLLSAIGVVAAQGAAPGDLDGSFSADGLLTADLGGDDAARAVAIQPDGRIVAAGIGGAGSDFALARFKPDGSPDTSFSGDGEASLDLGSADTAEALAIASDGSIVVAGTSGSDIAVARFKGDGTVDTTFSPPDGFERTDVSGIDRGHDLVLRSDGRIVVGGIADELGAADFALVGYSATGTVDPSFSPAGAPGVETTDFGGHDEARGLALQSNGKVVAAGSAAATKDIGVARYTPTGELDAGFSGDGKLTTDLGEDESAAAVEIDTGKRIVVAGTQAGPTSARFVVARYLPAAGGVDTSFGAGDGVENSQTLPAAGDEVNGLALQPDRRIVVVGASTGTIELLRLNTKGSPDTQFSGDGRVSTAFAEGAAAAVGTDGRIVVAGATDTPPDFALARYVGITCSGRATTRVGTPKNDTVKATKRKDVIATGDGGDMIQGRGGNDVICGGDGGDTILGQAGKDRLYGGKGRDKLYGGKGKDRIKGGAGKDYRSAKG